LINTNADVDVDVNDAYFSDDQTRDDVGDGNDNGNDIDNGTQTKSK